MYTLDVKYVYTCCSKLFHTRSEKKSKIASAVF